MFLDLIVADGWWCWSSSIDSRTAWLVKEQRLAVMTSPKAVFRQFQIHQRTTTIFSFVSFWEFCKSENISDMTLLALSSYCLILLHKFACSHKCFAKSQEMNAWHSFSMLDSQVTHSGEQWMLFLLKVGAGRETTSQHSPKEMPYLGWELEFPNSKQSPSRFKWLVSSIFSITLLQELLTVYSPFWENFQMSWSWSIVFN